MENEKRVWTLARAYYSRKDIQKAIFEFCKNRETIPRHFDNFGKRPDTLEYPSDILQQLKKGFTSFHCSQELWRNPLELSTDLKQEELNELRQGWDLLIDIDSKYLDYSKIACLLIVEALKFHSIKNFSVKFSGSKGFHIIVPWKAFPQKLAEEKTRNMFPEWARIITQYLNAIIKNQLVERISELTQKEMKETSKYIKGEEEVDDAIKKVTPDLVLVSSRHLFRAPYSLHEKGLSSVVLDEKEISGFQPKMAEPFRVRVKNFYPEAKENEAKELLISALDWYKGKSKKEETEKKERKFEEVKIDKSKIVYPPCIENIMRGLSDGRKRAVFILINYFKSLNLDFEEIEKKLEDWNKLNKPPLKQGYISSQLLWHKRQKKVLPPNCITDWYKGIGVCIPDDFCPKIKNPVNYTTKKFFINSEFLGAQKSKRTEKISDIKKSKFRK